MLIHAYFGVDMEIIWDIVENKVPKLKEKIEEILLKLNTSE
ncbi:MAG: HepT-like ribonuclease domain-containing protein [Candidatus Helarchaeota archaeon]